MKQQKVCVKTTKTTSIHNGRSLTTHALSLRSLSFALSISLSSIRALSLSYSGFGFGFYRRISSAVTFTLNISHPLWLLALSQQQQLQIAHNCIGILGGVELPPRAKCRANELLPAAATLECARLALMEKQQVLNTIRKKHAQSNNITTVDATHTRECLHYTHTWMQSSYVKILMLIFRCECESFSLSICVCVSV